MTVEAVEAFSNALGSNKLELIGEGGYSNRCGQAGYWATYRIADQYLWFSVSATEARLAADEVAVAISASGRWIQRSNSYLNKNGERGFEATVLSGGHAFMLGAAPELPPVLSRRLGRCRG